MKKEDGKVQLLEAATRGKFQSAESRNKIKMAERIGTEEAGGPMSSKRALHSVQIWH